MNTYQCDFHVAVLAPMGAPGVANDPEALDDIQANDILRVTNLSYDAQSENIPLLYKPILVESIMAVRVPLPSRKSIIACSLGTRYQSVTMTWYL